MTEKTITVDPDLTAHIQSATLPPSNILSEESKDILRRSRPTEGPGAAPPPRMPAMDATVEELIEVYRLVQGKEHPDWDEYRRVMVADERVIEIPWVLSRLVPSGRVLESAMPSPRCRTSPRCFAPVSSSRKRWPTS